MRNNRVDDIRNGRLSRIESPTQQHLAIQRENEALKGACQDLENRNTRLQTELERTRIYSQKVLEAHKTARDTGSRLAEESASKDAEIHKLQQEIVQYKSIVASSTVFDKQLSDTTIQDKINALFFTVRDWALSVVLRGNVGESHVRVLHIISRPLMSATVLVIDPMEPYHTFLWSQVPRSTEQDTNQKVHALIAMFSGVLISFFNEDIVFGLSSEKSVQSATRFYRSFEGMAICWFGAGHQS